MGARQYTQREWRLLSWWLATYHPDAEIFMNVRVGPVASTVNPSDAIDQSVGALKVRNRWADAIFFENDTANIVEAKIEPDPGIFSQLIHYARKFRQDPTFAQWKSKPVNLVALVYHDDPSVAQEASYYGVNWVVYQPALKEMLPPRMKGSALNGLQSPLPSDWPARLQAWGIASVANIGKG